LVCPRGRERTEIDDREAETHVISKYVHGEVQLLRFALSVLGRDWGWSISKIYFRGIA
jgi:hypothetical protein